MSDDLLFQPLLHWHKWRQVRYLWPTRATCGLDTDDVGLIDGGLQRREGCRQARGTPYSLGGNIAMLEHT